MYRRICENLNDYGKLVPAKDSISKYIKNRNKDYYVSVYKYTEQHKEKFEKDNTVAGIKDVITDTLIFDFDDENNLDNARKDALTLVQRLKSKGVDGYDIFYSGSKGFHVSFQMDKELSPKEAKAVAKELAGDLKSFDTKCYNSNRIIRVANTKHPETGLFKTQISEYELQESTIDEIKDFSSGNYEVVEQESKSNISTSFYGFIDGVVSKLQNSTSKPVEVDGKPDLGRNPFKLSPWKLALFQGFYPPGQRNHSLMILASTLKSRGLDQEECYSILKGVNRKQAARYKQEPHPKEELYNNVVEVVYGETWEGATYSEDSFDPKLQEYLVALGIPRKGEKNLKDLEDVSDVFNVFQDYAQNIDKNTIKTGIPGLDKICRITTSMLVGLLGAPASGKTATLLNTINVNSKTGEKSVVFSLDMGRPLVYMKLAEKHTKHTQDQIFEAFKSGNKTIIEEVRNVIEENYKNVKFCFKTSSTVADMKTYIEQYERNSGEKVRLVFVDYLEKVAGGYSDPSVNAGIAAKQLQEMANDLEVCVVMLLQPQKMVGTPSDPITSYRNIKGSSLTEQDCRVIIGLYRDGYNPESFEDDNYITYTVLKNTMGKLGKVDCSWEGKTGKVRPLEDIERMELEELRERKRRQKAEESF